MDYISPNEAELKLKWWPKNIIAAGYRHTIGLKSDGTVVAVGDNKYGQCDVSGWHDIVAVAGGGGGMLIRVIPIPSGLNRTVRWRLWVGTSMINAM